MTRTEITNIAHLMDLSPLCGDYASSFDLDAAQAELADVVEIAAKRIVASVSIHRNGLVFADYADRVAASEIVFPELLKEIDPWEILSRHEH